MPISKEESREYQMEKPIKVLMADSLPELLRSQEFREKIVPELVKKWQAEKNPSLLEKAKALFKKIV